MVPAVALYWALPWQRARLAVLFCASMVFYAAHHWPRVLLLLATIGFNFFMGRLQHRSRSATMMLIAVGVNLSLLLWFKYTAFIAESINAMLAMAGSGLSVPRPPAFLPLGISFFTFQVVAYQIALSLTEIDPGLLTRTDPRPHKKRGKCSQALTG